MEHQRANRYSKKSPQTRVSSGGTTSESQPAVAINWCVIQASVKFKFCYTMISRILIYCLHPVRSSGPSLVLRLIDLNCSPVQSTPSEIRSRSSVSNHMPHFMKLMKVPTRARETNTRESWRQRRRCATAAPSDGSLEDCPDWPFSTSLESESTIWAYEGGGAWAAALIDLIVRLKSPS